MKNIENKEQKIKEEAKLAKIKKEMKANQPPTHRERKEGVKIFEVKL